MLHGSTLISHKKWLSAALNAGRTAHLILGTHSKAVSCFQNLTRVFSPWRRLSARFHERGFLFNILMLSNFLSNATHVPAARAPGIDGFCVCYYHSTPPPLCQGSRRRPRALPPAGNNFNPITVRVLNKIIPHGLIFKADAAHALMLAVGRLIIIRLKGQVKLIVA